MYLIFRARNVLCSVSAMTHFGHECIPLVFPSVSRLKGGCGSSSAQTHQTRVAAHPSPRVLQGVLWLIHCLRINDFHLDRDSVGKARPIIVSYP